MQNATSSNPGGPLPAAKPLPRNSLLLTLRKWHGWLGVAMSVLILHEAKGKWGEVPLEKVEFKFERGSLLCKVTSSDKYQLVRGAMYRWSEIRKGDREVALLISG